jgi:hypothetical protein
VGVRGPAFSTILSPLRGLAPKFFHFSFFIFHLQKPQAPCSMPFHYHIITSAHHLFFLNLGKGFTAMITKTQIINTLENLPEDLSIDQVIDHLIFLEKVQKGLDDSANGRTYTKEEAREKLQKWLK